MSAAKSAFKQLVFGDENTTRIIMSHPQDGSISEDVVVLQHHACGE